MHILRNMANFLLKRAEVLKICTFKENLTKYCQICLFTLLTKTLNFETTIIFCFNKHQNSNAHFKRMANFLLKRAESLNICILIENITKYCQIFTFTHLINMMRYQNSCEHCKCDVTSNMMQSQIRWNLKYDGISNMIGPQKWWYLKANTEIANVKKVQIWCKCKLNETSNMFTLQMWWDLNYYA